MVQHQAQQLPLPCTIDEVVHLLDEVTSLRYEVQRPHATIHALQEQLDATKADCETWRERQRLAEAKLNAAYTDIALLQTHLAVARMVVLNRAPTLPDWFSPELRRLLTLAHPDKWSQGQDATALAHEVAAAVNTVRQRLGEVQA